MTAIVLVQRNATRRAELRQALAGSPLDVLEAGSAIEGIDVVEAAPAAPDLLVTDVRLDRGDGLRLATALRGRSNAARAVYVGGFVDALFWPVRTYVIGEGTAAPAVARMVERLVG